MDKLNNLYSVLIKKIKQDPLAYGLKYKECGKYSDFEKYSNKEIIEMYYGIYKESKMLLVDGGYFINLNDVVNTFCVLKYVSFILKPSKKNPEIVYHNDDISNIKIFFVSDYFLVTKNEKYITNRHAIGNFLCKIGVIRQSKKIIGLYSVSNDSKILLLFKRGKFPADLYYPIERYINSLFFNVDNYFPDFKVESKL
jgi:hypothetical protein